MGRPYRAVMRAGKALAGAEPLGSTRNGQRISARSRTNAYTAGAFLPIGGFEPGRVSSAPYLAASVHPIRMT
jgi:hypothetical protein